MPKITTTFADKLTTIALKQFRAGFDFKKSRMEEIRKNEEFYYGRNIKVPKGRFGVPLPTMSGFVDTLMSKIDDPPTIKYGYTDMADLKIAQKVTAAWAKDSSSVKGKWNQKDRWAKKQACFSGRATFKYFAESDPRYRSVLEVVDYEDFVCEPAGGGNLEEHLFLGQDNIFKTKDNLESGEQYSKEQVTKLIAATGDKDFKKNENLWKGKEKRYQLLGLDIGNNTYVGQSIFKLIEWGMEYEGKRYYLLFDYITGTWVRCEELVDVFESELWPWASWATHEDAFVFWTKAPCDDVRPVADAIDTLFNQALENRNKRNMGMRAYDPDIFKDPSELEWRPNGLAAGSASVKGKTLAQGIYEFRTDEITGTIDMVAFMDSYIGRKSGITPESQGVADKDQKVGIYFGSLQQVADRLGLYNKSYRECWEEEGLRYAWGLKEHLNEKMLVKMVGEQGVEWNELVKGEAKKAPDLDIEITGGAAEVAANEMKKKERSESLLLMVKRPDLSARINPDWLVQEILKQGSWEDAEVKMAMSKESGNLEILAEASEAIQQIMKGETPKINRGANTSFIQKIMDFAVDKDVEMDVYKGLMSYAQAHIEIAMGNMRRSATALQIQRAEQGPEQGQSTVSPAEGVRTPEPTPGTPGEAIGKGLEKSNMLTGQSPAPAV